MPGLAGLHPRAWLAGPLFSCPPILPTCPRLSDLRYVYVIYIYLSILIAGGTRNRPQGTVCVLALGPPSCPPTQPFPPTDTARGHQEDRAGEDEGRVPRGRGHLRSGLLALTRVRGISAGWPLRDLGASWPQATSGILNAAPEGTQERRSRAASQPLLPSSRAGSLGGSGGSNLGGEGAKALRIVLAWLAVPWGCSGEAGWHRAPSWWGAGPVTGLLPGPRSCTCPPHTTEELCRRGFS